MPTMPTIPTTLGQQLADWRTTKGWSQEAVARKIGVTNMTVARWEWNQYHPAYDHCRALMRLGFRPVKETA